MVLVVAVLAALFAAQRLRRSDPVVLGVMRTVAFSPIGSRPKTGAVSFYLKRKDTVAVSVVDSRGDVVRQLVAAIEVPARRRARFAWDGNGSDGRRVPDGEYRFRVGLAGQGRSVTIPFTVTLDTVPARPWISDTRPAHPPGPYLLPARVPPTGVIAGTIGRDVTGLVLRTDSTPARVVQRIPLPNAARLIGWDGLIAGKPAPDGIYMLGLIETDRAGNKGSFPPVLAPVPGPVRGSPGVTVRRLGVAPPTLPVAPGKVVTVAVDSRGSTYRWALRILGTNQPVATGTSRATKLRIKVPGSARGLGLLSVVGGGRRVEVPIAVTGRRAPLLVVMPAIRWQGVAPVDQTGDGLPDVLTAGREVDLSRLVGPLPGGLDGLRSDVLPLLKQLAKARMPFELTTDIALASGRGPRLSSHHGVILAGDETWLPDRALAALKARVVSGGGVLDLGLDGLTRTVRISGNSASRPSAPRPADVFGAVRAVRLAEPEDLLAWKDNIGLFDQTGGRLEAPPGSVGTKAVLPPGRLEAAAGLEAGRPTIAAWRLGRGLVIRPGIVHLAALAGSDQQALGLLRQAIRLTARGPG